MYFVILIFFFLLSTCISFILLSYELSYKNFILLYKKEFLISAFIFFIPKLILLFFNYSYCFSLDFFLLNIAFMIMIITDIIEKSIFTIIPFTTIVLRFLSLIFMKDYFFIIESFFSIIIILVFYYLIYYLFLFLLKKEAIGFGDILCFFMLSFYSNIFLLGIIFWISSLLGLLFILCYKLLFWKKKILSIIPFVPCIYLGYEIVIFIKINTTFFLLFQ